MENYYNQTKLITLWNIFERIQEESEENEGGKNFLDSASAEAHQLTEIERGIQSQENAVEYADQSKHGIKVFIKVSTHFHDN